MNEETGKVEVVFKRSSSKDGKYGFDVTVQLPATKQIDQKILETNAEMAYQKAVQLIRQANTELGDK